MDLSLVSSPRGYLGGGTFFLPFISVHVVLVQTPLNHNLEAAGPAAWKVYCTGVETWKLHIDVRFHPADLTVRRIQAGLDKQLARSRPPLMPAASGGVHVSGLVAQKWLPMADWQIESCRKEIPLGTG